MQSEARIRIWVCIWHASGASHWDSQVHFSSEGQQCGHTQTRWTAGYGCSEQSRGAEPGEGTGHREEEETRVDLQGRAGREFHRASPQEHFCPRRLEPRTAPECGAGRGAQSAVSILWMAAGRLVPGTL